MSKMRHIKIDLFNISTKDWIITVKFDDIYLVGKNVTAGELIDDYLKKQERVKKRKSKKKSNVIDFNKWKDMGGQDG